MLEFENLPLTSCNLTNSVITITLGNACNWSKASSYEELKVKATRLMDSLRQLTYIFVELFGLKNSFLWTKLEWTCGQMPNWRLTCAWLLSKKWPEAMTVDEIRFLDVFSMVFKCLWRNPTERDEKLFFHAAIADSYETSEIEYLLIPLTFDFNVVILFTSLFQLQHSFRGLKQ
jgi:hypothetical protein